MSLQVPYNCGIHSYFGMQTSHVTFSHSVLKLRVVFFTSYLGFKVKFSIKILPVICRPKQRFLFFLMAAFFLGGGGNEKSPPELKISWVGIFFLNFLSKRGAKVLPLWPPFSEWSHRNNTRLRGWNFVEISRRKFADSKRGLKFWTSMIEMMLHEKNLQKCFGSSASGHAKDEPVDTAIHFAMPGILTSDLCWNHLLEDQKVTGGSCT